MTEPLLKVEALSARYGKVEALRQIALSVGTGQIVTVIGANGAGKSTLLNALMGALPANAGASGTVELDGLDMSRWDVERRVHAGVCLVPEKRDLFGSMSVLDNLRLGAFRRYRRREKNWDDQLERVFELFPRLKERVSQQAGTLSGGERQMLALGRALMAKATPSDARRTKSRARAAHCARDLRHHRSVKARRRRSAAGRTKCTRGLAGG